jgi:hypothetical protein
MLDGLQRWADDADILRYIEGGIAEQKFLGAISERAWGD